MLTIPQKLRFFKDYNRNLIYIIAISLIAIIVITIVENALMFRYRNQRNEQSLIKTSHEIENLIHDSISMITNNAIIIGKEIAGNDKMNINDIANLINTHPYYAKNSYNLFISTLYDWVDANDKMLATSDIGVLPKPFDMSHREYLKKTKKEPWVLQLQEPASGIPSKQLIIPAGVGVTNKQGKYIGSVTMGFAIDGLEKRIDEILVLQDISYVVLSQNDVIIATNSKLLRAGEKFKQYPTEYQYSFAEKFKEHPYKIITGYSTAFLYKQLYTMLSIAFVEFMVLFALVCVIICLQKYLTYTKFIKNATTTSIIENHILSNHTMEFIKTQINDTIQLVEENAIKRERIQKFSDIEKQEMYSVLAALRVIYNKLFSASDLHLKAMDLRKIVESVLKLHAYEISVSHIKIQTTLLCDELIFVDAIKLKKVFGFILLHILEISEKNEFVKILLEKESKYIKISFLHQKLSCSKIMNCAIDSEINYSYVERVVIAHGGKLECAEGKIVLTLASE